LIDNYVNNIRIYQTEYGKKSRFKQNQVPVPALTTSVERSNNGKPMTDAATTKTSLNKFEKFKAEKDLAWN